MTVIAGGVILDLDDTMVDTSSLRDLRRQRRWKDAVRNIGDTIAFEGIDDLVGALHRGNTPWAVVTTSVSYYAHAVLRHHGIRAPHLVAYHDATPKPSAAPIVKALEAMGVPAEKAVAVGDNEIDLRAYRRAGVIALGAGWSPHLTGDEWHEVVASPRDLLAYL